LAANLETEDRTDYFEMMTKLTDHAKIQIAAPEGIPVKMDEMRNVVMLAIEQLGGKGEPMEQKQIVAALTTVITTFVDIKPLGTLPEEATAAFANLYTNALYGHKLLPSQWVDACAAAKTVVVVGDLPGKIKSMEKLFPFLRETADDNWATMLKKMDATIEAMPPSTKTDWAMLEALQKKTELQDDRVRVQDFINMLLLTTHENRDQNNRATSVVTPEEGDEIFICLEQGANNEEALLKAQSMMRELYNNDVVAWDALVETLNMTPGMLAKMNRFNQLFMLAPKWRAEECKVKCMRLAVGAMLAENHMHKKAAEAATQPKTKKAKPTPPVAVSV